MIKVVKYILLTIGIIINIFIFYKVYEAIYIFDTPNISTNTVTNNSQTNLSIPQFEVNLYKSVYGKYLNNVLYNTNYKPQNYSINEVFSNNN